MHDVLVTLKNGSRLSGPLWEWRPKEGWFSLAGQDTEKILLSEVESAIQKGVRVAIDRVEDVDLLTRARREDWAMEGSEKIRITDQRMDKCLILQREEAGAHYSVHTWMGDVGETPALIGRGVLRKEEWGEFLGFLTAGCKLILGQPGHKEYLRMKSKGDPLLDLHQICVDKPCTREEITAEMLGLGWGDDTIRESLALGEGVYFEVVSELYTPLGGTTRDLINKVLRKGQ